MQPEIKFTGGTKLKAFLAKVGKGGVGGVKVGVFSEARYDDKNLTQVAAVAATNEFGVPGWIPERPFFRRGLAAMEGDVLDVLKGGIDPKTMVVDSRIAEVVGQVAQNAIQREIETSEAWAEPNAPSTIEAKGSSGPLRDTALLRNSITYKVEK